MKFLGLPALCSAGLLATSAMAAPVKLDFSGIATGAQVANFYNNAADPTHNFGVTFSSTALGASTGNFANNPDPGVMYMFPAGGTTGLPTSTLMSYAAGFTGDFSFYFSSLQAVTLDFYSAVDGSGSAIASYTFAAPDLSSCPSSPKFCVWSGPSVTDVTLAGLAKSVKFSGLQAQSLFDDITFNPAAPGGGGTAPEPTSLALAALALLGLAASRQRLKG